MGIQSHLLQRAVDSKGKIRLLNLHPGNYKLQFSIQGQQCSPQAIVIRSKRSILKEINLPRNGSEPISLSINSRTDSSLEIKTTAPGCHSNGDARPLRYQLLNLKISNCSN